MTSLTSHMTSLTSHLTSLTVSSTSTSMPDEVSLRREVTLEGERFSLAATLAWSSLADSCSRNSAWYTVEEGGGEGGRRKEEGEGRGRGRGRREEGGGGREGEGGGKESIKYFLCPRMDISAWLIVSLHATNPSRAPGRCKSFSQFLIGGRCRAGFHQLGYTAPWDLDDSVLVDLLLCNWRRDLNMSWSDLKQANRVFAVLMMSLWSLWYDWLLQSGYH